MSKSAQPDPAVSCLELDAALSTLRLLQLETREVLWKRLGEQEALVARLLEEYASPRPGQELTKDAEGSACAHRWADAQRDDPVVLTTSIAGLGAPAGSVEAVQPRESDDPSAEKGLTREALTHMGMLRSNSVGHRYCMPNEDRGPLGMEKVMGALKQEEPQHSGLLGRIVESRNFNILCTVIILVNCITAIVVADARVRELRDPPRWIEVLEHAFLTFYTLELLLKLVVKRLYFFVGKDRGSNIFDLVIVSLDLLSTALQFISDSGTIDLTFLRSCRIFKITRVLRLVRASDVFVELKLLLMTITGSFFSLLWCALVVFFTLLLFALLFVQIVTDFIMENPDLPCDENECMKRDLLAYFGSLGQAMLSLYMATTGGEDWIVFYSILSRTGIIASFAMVLFTFSYQFGMFNLLTSMFVERTTKTGLPDRDARILEQRASESKQTAELLALFRECDVDSDGTVTFDEFQALMQKEKISAYLASIGLEISDAYTFFKLLISSCPANGEDSPVVPVEQFVQGCMRMKGQATSIDVQVLSHQNLLLGDKLARLSESVTALTVCAAREPAYVNATSEDATEACLRL